MRHIVAAILVICGTLLALAPQASNTLQGWRLADALAERIAHTSTQFFRQPLGEGYMLSTWMIGGAMIIAGIACAFATASTPPSADKRSDSPQTSH